MRTRRRGRLASAGPLAGRALRLLALLVLAVPTASRGTVRLLDENLRTPLPGLAVDGPAAIDLSARPASLLAAAQKKASVNSDKADNISEEKAGAPAAQPDNAPRSLDFDLLGAPPPPPPVDDGKLRLRRGMLTAHQAVGFGLFALQLATTVVGQLNYSDRFADGPGTAKYQQTHAILAYTNLAAFVATGALALFAPAPPKRTEGFDRVTLHKIAMFTAAAGMVAQGVLGIVTRQREGYLNQPTYADVHLIIGYATMAALATGVGAGLLKRRKIT